MLDDDENNTNQHTPIKTGVAAAELKSFVERLERLDEERKQIGYDMRDVLAEAKGRGYDTGAIKKLIALRKQDASERQEADAILDLYKSALGMA